MNRIVYMVMRNLPWAPYWFFTIDKMGKHLERYSEQTRYDFLRNMVININKRGRVKLVTTGAEHLPEKDGFILFPNHQGLYDMLALVETCPRPLSVVIKQEASQWILVKQVLRMIEGISLDRSDIKASMEMIREVSRRVKNGKNYVIFAEGTRSKNGNQILEFKAGTFKSAVSAGCPIVPVAMINSFRPFDISSIKKETVQVHYLDPIYPEQYMGMKTREIADLVHDKIQEKINENI